MNGFVPNEPNIRCETNLQAKELEVRRLGEYEVQNKGLGKVNFVGIGKRIL